MHRFVVSFTVVSLGTLTAAQGFAESARDIPRLGMAPGEPLVRSAPPAIPFGKDPAESEESVLDFHGFLQLPLQVGVLQRPAPQPGQASTTLHSPPLLPQEPRTFQYTAVIPRAWIQFAFSYGNRTVAATAIAVAESATDAAGFFRPGDQLGINDAFITVNLSEPVGTPFELKLGAFTGRYGPMGQFDAGRYATPLIARTNAVGETVTTALDLGGATLVLEQGIGGQLGRPPDDYVPAGWNDYGDTGAIGTPSQDAPAGVGSSLVSHLHAGLGFGDTAQIGAHYLTGWSQDDRASVRNVPDGRISVFGGDLRLTAGRFGHLYLGVARTVAVNSAVVSGIIEVLNARGGSELIREYLGPASRGDGALTTFGGQYDLSVARLMYGDRFRGKSPDVRLSLFGIGTKVESDDASQDGVMKLKLGAEATYSPLSWFGLSGRFDHVRPNEDTRQAFSILSPRLLFHTDWLSRDEFALQYSHFVYGGDVIVRTGYPPVDDPSAVPDEDVFTISGTFWW